MNEEYQNTFKEVYETAANRPNGYQWEYKDYTLLKAEKALTTRHSEVRLYNPEMNKVQCYIISAFEDWETFAQKVLELVEYDPNDLHDWVNRERKND